MLAIITLLAQFNKFKSSLEVAIKTTVLSVFHSKNTLTALIDKLPILWFLQTKPYLAFLRYFIRSCQSYFYSPLFAIALWISSFHHHLGRPLFFFHLVLIPELFLAINYHSSSESGHTT